MASRSASSFSRHETYILRNNFSNGVNSRWPMPYANRPVISRSVLAITYHEKNERSTAAARDPKHFRDPVIFFETRFFRT